jgi:hypothetical protein
MSMTLAINEKIFEPGCFFHISREITFIAGDTFYRRRQRHRLSPYLLCQKTFAVNQLLINKKTMHSLVFFT